VQLAARQHGFEQVARVHGTFGLARAHYGVQFVDEQNDLPLALFHLVEHGLEAFLEFATVFCACNERAHIKSKELAALEALRHVALDDAEGQTFHDGGFAHARLAYEHRVVFGAARENANNAADFGISANDRVHLALAGCFHEIAGILGQRFKGVFGGGAGHARAAAQLFHGCHKTGAGDLVFLENFAKRRGGRNIGKRGKQVVNAYVFVLHAVGFVLRIAQNFCQPLGNHDLVGVHAAAGNRRPLAQRALDGNAEGLGLHAHLFQNARHDAVFLLYKGQGQMLGIRLLMAHACGNALGLPHSLAGFIRKFVDVHKLPPHAPALRRAKFCYFWPGGCMRSNRLFVFKMLQALHPAFQRIYALQKIHNNSAAEHGQLKVATDALKLAYTVDVYIAKKEILRRAGAGFNPAKAHQFLKPLRRNACGFNEFLPDHDR